MNKKIKRLVSFLLVAVMAFSLCACGEIEEEVVQRASAIPQTKAEIFDYFCAALDKVVAEKPAVSYGWDFHPRLIPLGIWDETYIEHTSQSVAIKPVVEKLYANVKCGNEAQISIDSNSKPDYREKLEEELKALRESEMWQTAVTVRKLRPENN